MARKKVLIITYYWPPSGGAGVQRWVKFSKYLPEFDIEPVILTVKNGTYPILDKSLSKDLPADLKVSKSKSIEPYSLFSKLTGKSVKDISTPSKAFSKEGNWVQKIGVWTRSNLFIPDARIGWIPYAYSKAQEIIRDYSIDTFITTGPPNSTHIVGTKLKSLRPDLKWIMDMRDPWSQIFYNESLPRTQLAKSIDETLERNALKAADKVIVVSKHMKQLQQSIFKREYHIISNGFDHQEIRNMGDHSPASQKFVIKYIGSMTEPAIPYNFFEALSRLNQDDRKRIRIEFIGSYNPKVHQVIAQYELNDIVFFKGYLPHLEAKAEMRSADALLLVIPRTKDNKLILTGKLFDYIAAQRPILYIGPKDGDAADIINTYNLGVLFDYDETAEIYKRLQQCIAGKEIPYQKWDSEFKSHPFSRFSLTRKLASFLKQNE